MSFVYSFVATKNNDGDEYANFMQSYTSQTFITLTKTNTQMYILDGGYVHLLRSLSLPVLHMCIFRVSMSRVVACSYFDSQIAGLRRPSSTSWVSSSTVSRSPKGNMRSSSKFPSPCPRNTSPLATTAPSSPSPPCASARVCVCMRVCIDLHMMFCKIRTV